MFGVDVEKLTSGKTLLPVQQTTRQIKVTVLTFSTFWQPK
jgi:hypothetical protein